MPLEKWLGIVNEEQLHQWQRQRDTVASRMLQKTMKIEMAMPTKNDSSGYMPNQYFLPELDPNGLHQCLNSDNAEDFIARPKWQGQTCETSSLSRQQNHPLVAKLLSTKGHGVSTRIVARLVELAGLPVQCEQLIGKLFSLRRKQNATSTRRITGTGMAQVEAARGRLVHRVELNEGRAQRYQILAPTEWNFHPKGVAADLLKTLPATDRSSLLERADLLINSIDPCVSYQLELH
jgi:Ni,Fe-hydrogenase I large subunit